MDPVREEVRLPSLRMLLHREWLMDEDIEEDRPAAFTKKCAHTAQVLIKLHKMQQIKGTDSVAHAHTHRHRYRRT